MPAHRPASDSDRGSVSVLLLLAAGIGILLSVFYTPFSILLQPAGILSGLVPVFPQSVMPDIYRSTASMGALATALLLKVGISPVTASNLIGMVNGAIYCQALALLCFAYCRRTLASVALGTAMLILSVRRAAFLNGPDYPIMIFAEQSYGILGFGLALLAAGLFSSGLRKGGLAVLGLSVAMHPVLGGWVVFTALLAFPRIRPALAGLSLRSMAPWLGGTALLLCAVTFYSLGLRSTVSLPPVDPLYQLATFDVWDGHRNVNPGPMHLGMVTQGAVFAVLLAVYVRRLRADPARGALTCLLLVQAILGLALYGLYHAFSEVVPVSVKLVIPARFINFATAASVPVTIGLLLDRRFGLFPLVGISLLATASLCAYFADSIAAWVPWDQDPLNFMLLELGALIVAAGIAAGQPWLPDIPKALPFLRGWFRTGNGVVAALLAGPRATLAAGLLSLAMVGTAFRIETVPDAMAKVPGIVMLGDLFAKSPGTIIVAEDLDLNSVPVLGPYLFDLRNIDYLPYVPAAATRVAAILEDFCNVDYLNPPAQARGHGGLPGGICRPVWERRSRQEWSVLKARYNLGYVVTPDGWTLNMPLRARGLGLAVYAP